MDNTEQIKQLSRQGKSCKEIQDRVGCHLSYVYRILGDVEKESRLSGSVIFDKRNEQRRLEKKMRELLPFENIDDKVEFHRMRKEVEKIQQDINFFERNNRPDLGFASTVDCEI